MLAKLAAHLLGMAFPYGTLVVNVAGSVIMGVLAEYFAFHGELPQEIRLFLTTGVDFLDLSLNAIILWERGQWGAAAYVAISLVLSLTGLVAGLVRFLVQAQVAWEVCHLPIQYPANRG